MKKRAQKRLSNITTGVNFYQFLIDNEKAVDFVIKKGWAIAPICKCGTQTKKQKYSKLTEGFCFRCTKKNCKNT